MDDFRTLREYQVYLRDRMEAARLGDGSEKIVRLGFVSGGKNYLIDGRDVVDVHQISTLEPIPGGKPWVSGAANIKGSVCAVTDFSILLGGEKTKRGKFMVLSPGVIPGAAILIESISGLFDEKEAGEFTALSGAGVAEWLTGFHQIGTRFFVVDAGKLANDVRFSKLQSGESQ